MTITDIILLLTLLVAVFYAISTYKLASDTKRLAESTSRLVGITSQQFRASWITNMFISFSIQIDEFAEELKKGGEGGHILVSNYQKHIDAMQRYFRIFTDLLTESQGKLYLMEKEKEFNQAISQNSFIDENFITRMQNYLYDFKEEMQKLMGKLLQS